MIGDNLDELVSFLELEKELKEQMKDLRNQLKDIKEEISEKKEDIINDLTTLNKTFAKNKNIAVTLFDKDEKKKPTKKEIETEIERIIFETSMEDREKKNEIFKLLTPQVIGNTKALKVTLPKRKS